MTSRLNATNDPDLPPHPPTGPPVSKRIVVHCVLWFPSRAMVSIHHTFPVIFYPIDWCAERIRCCSGVGGVDRLEWRRW